MSVEKRKSGWWIRGVPEYKIGTRVFTTVGPYRTRAEAEDDLRGLKRFYKWEHKAR